MADTTNRDDFDAHTLRVLEYSAIQKMLVERAACSLGQERALELMPTPLVAFVRERQQETSEARRLVDEHGPFPLGGIYDIRPLLVRSEVGQTLSPFEFLNISSTLLGATRVKQYILRHTEKAPLLADRAKAIDEFPPLLRDIEMCIGRNGEVLDSASPTLAQIRSRIRVLAARINEKLNSFVNSSTYRPMLMETNIVLRDDRRCLSVKNDYKRAIPGIIHDQSSSGATVFLEPMVVVEANNELRQAEAKEQQEIERVLAKLTATVAKFGEKIYGTVEVVAGLDLASAKAKLAEDMNAWQPIFSQNGVIKLRDARHPLINPDIVIPISVTFGDKAKALLITGPNTGGKTVTLKTVGLLTLMAQAGLHIPAASGSELAHFDQIFADIGDEQSITQSLSTFSAHITNIVRILRSVGMRALVLMDEVGAGTDPAEGAALAKAIVSYLLRHNARIIATTHYGELKEFAYMQDGVENAAVEFDPDTLRPTYRLLQGIPGSSNAFHIARRLGMPNPVVDAALNNLERADVETGVVMQQLEKAKRVADEERRKAERLSREVEDLKKKYEARLHDLEVLRREAKQRATEEAQQVIRLKTEKMNNLLGELRRQGKENRKTNSVRKKMQDTADELIGGIGYEQVPIVVEDDTTPAPKRLRRGDKVRVLSLGGMQGEVIADADAEEVMVQVGMMRVTVPLAQLRSASTAPIAIPEPNAAPFRGSSPRGGGTATIAREKAENISPELTLIAMRVDSALPRLDKYLDDAYAAGLESIRIVHGKGTGQLRKAIWDALKGDSRILAFQTAHPDEGGAGATVVRLNV